MSANFPTSLPNISNPSAGNFLNSPAHATQHGTANDEIAALAAKVGVDSSAVTTSHDYKLSGVTGTGKAVSTLGDQTITGTKTFEATVQTIVTNTDAATVTFDLSTGNIQQVTLGGNRTLALSNATTGQCFVIRLVQDGTGSRTVTWFSTIKWPGATAPTLTTTINRVDLFGFICTGSGTYDGTIIGQNLG